MELREGIELKYWKQEKHCAKNYATPKFLMFIFNFSETVKRGRAPGNYNIAIKIMKDLKR